MKSMLIISFSPIHTDARVLKQVEEFSRDHRVTTCGYGPQPSGAHNHIQIPDNVRVDDLSGRLITLRAYQAVYNTLSGVRWARKTLKPGLWDLIICNDVETVPIGLELEPREGLLADLHEYSPMLHSEHKLWLRRISPYVSWLIRKFVVRADAWTTVSGGLAREYERVFGFRPEVVTNATPLLPLSPTEPSAPLHFVHSGAGLRNRHLDETIRGFKHVEGARLDLYLTHNDPAYIDELRGLARDTEGRIRVLDPVPYDQLVSTLNRYDVGVFILPPINFSYEWALPNKLFDYVQARLGIIVGPSPEMAEVVTQYELGVVADGYTADDLAAAVRSLTPEAVAVAKQRAHENAEQLSSMSQVKIWRDVIDRLGKGRK